MEIFVKQHLKRNNVKCIYMKRSMLGHMSLKYIEYICVTCGRKEIKTEISGRPMPGKCPRKVGDKPHTWRKNRVISR